MIIDTKLNHSLSVAGGRQERGPPQTELYRLWRRTGEAGDLLDPQSGLRGLT